MPETPVIQLWIFEISSRILSKSGQNLCLVLFDLSKVESCYADYTKLIEDFISFPESPSLIFLDGYFVSYE
jgi:hypothetical protein